MAIMIPDKPKEIDPRSHEDIMFDELQKLPDEYYVFHSFEIVSIVNDIITESETDFVIFHPKKGIICLECKAGQVLYENGYWQYGSGIRMKHDGPYIQAKRHKWDLSDYMNEHGMQYENANCKKIHAVWFPDVPLSNFQDKYLPGEGDINITLTADSFGHIEECIEKLYQFKGQDKVETKLSEKDVNRILDRVLAPSFRLITLKGVEKERTKRVFKKMLSEQIALLNYLEEQNNAVISGLAGTGKTVMALEKAKRHSDRGESVLFLCYNSMLKEHLMENYHYQNVAFYTIDGLACKLCETDTADYALLTKKLEDMYLEESFPYQHVIIDEGQDFGKDRMEDAQIIDSLMLNTIGQKNNPGSFYLFYDKNQLVQSQTVPECISEADCKLTLYRNCRNTENIALTSLRLLGSDQEPKLINNAPMGDTPRVGFAKDLEDAVTFLDDAIAQLTVDGYSDITILTCKTEKNSIISDRIVDSKYKNKNGKYTFTTCRKFKGLESDAVIVIDIDKNTFDEDEGERYMYVGSSRARFKLYCILNMDENDCKELMEKRGIPYKKNLFKSFATALNAKKFEVAT